jgi:hypothetical protein
MAGFIGIAEMEMEMEMEMDAGPSAPLLSASPVLRPMGVSPTIGVSEPGEWYRGNRWPPAPRPPELPSARALPDKATAKWQEEVTRSWPNAVKSEGRPLLPERQWSSHFYSIALMGEFVSASIELRRLETNADKALFDGVMPIGETRLSWDSIDLRPNLFVPVLTENADYGDVTTELQELTRLIDYRPSVLSEALSQRNGIDNYFRGILSFTPSSHPWTFGLMQIALHVGEFQVMHYKYRFNRPRPSQLSPWLMPPIEVPGHASYPSGHSTQSHLVALVLGEVMPQPPAGQPNPLRLLAERIARNREVIGLHYPSDSRAGAKLAKESFLLLRECKTVHEMIREARGEWGRAVENDLAATIENVKGLG